MLTVLFVDDEPNVLQGIKRATRNMREVWAMYFAPGGESALAFIADTPVDVIVSDMRMPGMDGAELLRLVRERQPGIARIMLSGYAEEEAIFRSTQVAHQFLSKPCDVDELKATIEDIRACRDALPPDAIRDMVGRIESLPALGDVYADLTDAMDRDTANADNLGQIVSRDVALTAELLRLVNSAFFGLSRRIENVGQAIGFLGIDVVRAIVAGHDVFTTDNVDTVDVAALAKRSELTAALCRAAMVRDGATISEAADGYLAGMLHEIGALVLAQMDAVETSELEAVLAVDDTTNERLVLGVDRFTVAAYLLGLWGFPKAISGAIGALAREPDLDGDRVGRCLLIAREVVQTSEPTVLDQAEADLDQALDRAEAGLRERHRRPTAAEAGA